MKIALAQINPTIGAFKENVGKICKFIDRAIDLNADLIVFPEMSVIGYPPRDLLERPSFISDNLKALDIVKGRVKGIAAIVGFVDVNPEKRGKSLYNAAAFIHDGEIRSRHYKSLLPTYDVFDEHRYFEPAHSVSVAEYKGIKLGITICEDIWAYEEIWRRPIYHMNPVEELIDKGAEVVINISASPFDIEKINIRHILITGIASKYQVPLVYVNQVGGNDELIFDGNSVIVDAKGEIAAHAASFEEDLLVAEIRDKECISTSNQISPAAILNKEDLSNVKMIQNIHKALILGLRDYVRKCGFKKVVLGLSGGIDSAVVAALASQALGSNNVLGISMPSIYSSKESVDDAGRLAENLGMPFKVVPINKIYDVYLDVLKKEFEGLPFDVTEENLQARIRGNILMAFSNKYGYMVLTTGNKSELAVGYCTLYGDMCGGLAVISDLPKMMVYDLAGYINSEKEVIPLSTIKKPPSAELRPDQKDEDSLPPYPVLDGILKAYVEETLITNDIIDMGYEESTVREIVKKIDKNEYKRKQAAPGLKVTSKAFGSGRRIPIAQSYIDLL